MTIPYLNPMEDDPRCIHCGDWCTWVDDPAPDLCHMCAIAGRYSPMWGEERAAEYQSMLRRRGEPPE